MIKHKLGGMAYCKHTGKPLPPNLYSDPKGRQGIYRYRHEDGRMSTVRLPYARAVKAARRENAKRDAPDGSVSYWIRQFKQWQIDQTPEIDSKRGWRDRHRQLEVFGEQWDHLRPHLLTVSVLSDWWESLTYDQQHNRRSYFSQFFQWGMRKGVTRSNPFSKYDNVQSLSHKAKPAKQRPALSLSDFWQIHEHAAAHIQLAMVISLTTAMREGDICALRFDDVQDGYLCRTISKSLNQRGATSAAHLKWNLAEHTDLKKAIDQARELSMRHMRCPYIVSRPRQREKELAQGLTHTHQCKPEHISRGFKKARDATELWDDAAPTFHEIRGLAISLLIQSGRDLAAVQRLAAHTDPSITSAYTAGQAPHHLDMVGMVISVQK